MAFNSTKTLDKKEVNPLYTVYRRITGGEYLVERLKRVAYGPKYRWSKAEINRAVIYNNRRSAERIARKYGGKVVEIS